MMSCALSFHVGPSLTSSLVAQITLSSDYTSPGARGEPIHDHWNVSNRISPMRSFKMPVGDNPQINIVRLLGGKSKNGKMLVEEDTYKWDGQKFVYDWEPLHQQITVDTVFTHHEKPFSFQKIEIR